VIRTAADLNNESQERHTPVDVSMVNEEDSGCWYWFDCRFDWTCEWKLGRRRTNCEGPCPAPTDCKCNQGKSCYRKSCVHMWTSCTCE